MDDTQEPGPEAAATPSAGEPEEQAAAAPGAPAADTAEPPVPGQAASATEPDIASAAPVSRIPTAETADQSELDLGVISTGSPAVDEALEPLGSLAELPVGEHPQVFERVLGDLTATLSATDAAGAADARTGADDSGAGSPGDAEATTTGD